MKKMGQEIWKIKNQLSENLDKYKEYNFYSLTIIDKLNMYKLYIFAN